MILFGTRSAVHAADSVVRVNSDEGQAAGLRALSAVFRGAHYEFDVSHPNLDGFTELVEDWFEASWGRKVVVVIDGLIDGLAKKPAEFGPIVSVILDAEANLFEKQIRAGDKDARAKLDNIQILIA